MGSTFLGLGEIELKVPRARRRAVHLIWLTYGTAGLAAENAPARQIVVTAAEAGTDSQGFTALKGRSSTVLHACASFSAVCEAVPATVSVPSVFRNPPEKPAVLDMCRPVTLGKGPKGGHPAVNGPAPLPNGPQQRASADVFVSGHQWYAFGSGRRSNQPVGWIAGILGTA